MSCTRLTRRRTGSSQSTPLWTDSPRSKPTGSPLGEATPPGQLAYHLLFWNRRNLNALRGVKNDQFSGDNTETFDKFDRKKWTDILKQLDQVMTDLEKLFESADDQQLAKWATTVGNICTHNGYHTGQIVYVRKLQGSWNPDKGVK